MHKRKFLSGSAKRKSELIECGLSPGQQKIQFFMTGLNQSSLDTEGLPMENVIEQKECLQNSVIECEPVTDSQIEKENCTEKECLQNSVIECELASDSQIDTEKECLQSSAFECAFQLDNNVPQVITMTRFIRPSDNDSISIKNKFFSYHPIQTFVKTGKGKLDFKRIFYKHLINGDVVQIKWISYYLENNSLYCSNCMAYGERLNPAMKESKFITGYIADIKKRKTVRFNLNKHIDYIMNHNLMSKRAKEVETKRKVLDRLISIILFIGRQGIPYRGKQEGIYSLNKNGNHGNFLELVNIEKRFVPNENLLRDCYWLDPKSFSNIQSMMKHNDSLKTICELAEVDRQVICLELKQFASQFFQFKNVLPNLFFIDINYKNDTNYQTESSNDTEGEDNVTKIPDCSKCRNFYKFMLILPSTQVSCERVFSKLKIIKTKLRSTIKQKNLGPLMLMAVEKDIEIDREKLIDIVAHSSNLLRGLLI
ncbi:hypothetical protein AGLY_002116 [Aphis glycines]|uniref:HAT C-terminal dimerisation domain-containing protein n=1 Tax=Aphis glycines TaxID=307491 RepID=A0A6G0U4L8_APHGL|nr:hypothetical protein AGLY_002116 [Aphis glycines]